MPLPALPSSPLPTYPLPLSSPPPPLTTYPLPLSSPPPPFTQPLKDSHFTIPKSRYSPISFFLTTDTYNDVKYPVDRELYKKMRDEGDFIQFAKILYCGCLEMG